MLRRCANATAQSVTTLEPILPDDLWVELIFYGVKHQSVHALGLRIYQGNKVRYRMQPQHVQGFDARELKDYVDKIMAYLEREYNIERIGRYYWRDVALCPACSQEEF